MQIKQLVYSTCVQCAIASHIQSTNWRFRLPQIRRYFYGEGGHSGNVPRVPTSAKSRKSRGFLSADSMCPFSFDLRDVKCIHNPQGPLDYKAERQYKYIKRAASPCGIRVPVGRGRQGPRAGIGRNCCGWESTNRRVRTSAQRAVVSCGAYGRKSGAGPGVVDW